MDAQQVKHTFDTKCLPIAYCQQKFVTMHLTQMHLSLIDCNNHMSDLSRYFCLHLVHFSKLFIITRTSMYCSRGWLRYDFKRIRHFGMNFHRREWRESSVHTPKLLALAAAFIRNKAWECKEIRQVRTKTCSSPNTIFRHSSIAHILNIVWLMKMKFCKNHSQNLNDVYIKKIWMSFQRKKLSHIMLLSSKNTHLQLEDTIHIEK